MDMLYIIYSPGQGNSGPGQGSGVRAAQVAGRVKARAHGVAMAEVPCL